MNSKDKEILIAKIETLRWSFSDTQLQALTALMHDIVYSITCNEPKEMGFGAKKKEQND